MSIDGKWSGGFEGIFEGSSESGSISGTATFSFTVTGVLTGVNRQSSEVYHWTLKTPKKKYRIDPYDWTTLEDARLEILAEAEEIAEEVSLDVPVSKIVKQAIKAVEIPVAPQAAAKFIAQTREDYTKAVEAVLAIRRAVEEDEEEAMLLLL